MARCEPKKLIGLCFFAVYFLYETLRYCLCQPWFRGSNRMMVLAFICELCCLCLRPRVFKVQVLDGRTGLPLEGVRLELEAHDERMLLPGYPMVVGVSNSKGIISGPLSSSWISYTPSYYFQGSYTGHKRQDVQLDERRSVLGFWLLRRQLMKPQVVVP